MSAKTDAWMPLWIGSYLADTQHLTRDEHGGYLLLLMAYWRNKGPLQDDDKRLAAIVKASTKEWKILRPVLAEFFQIDGGQWIHKRVEIELSQAGARSEAAHQKAKAAAEKRWGKKRESPAQENPVMAASSTAISDAPSMPQALHEDCPTPSPSPSPMVNTPPKPPDEPDGGGGGGEVKPQVLLAGDICKALKIAGIGRVNPANHRLQMLVQAGATVPEFMAYVPAAKEKGDPFSWLLAAVEGERKRAKAMLPTLHQGAMQTPRPGAGESFRRQDMRDTAKRMAELSPLSVDRSLLVEQPRTIFPLDEATDVPAISSH